MINNFSFKHDLLKIIQMSKNFSDVDSLTINVEIEQNTPLKEINLMVEKFTVELGKLIKGKKVDYLFYVLEFSGINEEYISYNLKIVLVLPKLSLPKYKVKNIIHDVVGEETWSEFKFKRLTNDELVIEIIPIHLGIANPNILNKIPKEIYNVITNDSFFVIPGELLGRNIDYKMFKFAGKGV
jgi:hypothetical protein